MNSRVSIYWAVPVKKWDKELVSLTGSASVVSIWWRNYLVDLWMFQWWLDSDNFNRENIDFLQDVDGVIITHSHMDHIWRLPLLYKNGFRWKIYMTEVSAQIWKHMLLDTVKIENDEKNIRIARNNKLWKRLKKAIFLLSHGRWLSREDRTELKQFLDYYSVVNEGDIAKVMEKINNIPFDEEDVEGVLWLIETLEYWQEFILSNRSKSLNKRTHEDSQRILSIPYNIHNWGSIKKATVSRSEKSAIKKEWWILLEKEKKKLVEWERNVHLQELFSKKLETAFNFVYNQWPHIENALEKWTEAYDNNYDEYNRSLELLGDYGVTSKWDIQDVTSELWRELPFTQSDIDKAAKLLIVEGGKNRTRDIVSITLSDAAHILGSSSVVFSHYPEVNPKVSQSLKNHNKAVKGLLDITWEAYHIHFSWDLGRLEWNRLGRPDLPVKKVSYLQIESTYGGRNHEKREKAVGELVSSIENSEGNVLVSWFSQQRAQEVLLSILEDAIQNKKSIPYNLYLDGKLAQEVSRIYVNMGWKVYNLLEPEPQMELFWREVIQFLGEGEWEWLYYWSWEKNVVIASSGMMNWGAIMQHLPMILPDEKATLLAPWYLAHGTLGRRIVFDQVDSIKLWDKTISVKCEKKFIDGFSSHIGHDEIIEYIWDAIKAWKLEKNATVALTHGDRRGQELLKTDLKQLFKSLWREDIQITIPELFSEYDISEHEFSQVDIDGNPLMLTVLKSTQGRPRVPRILHEDK